MMTNSSKDIHNNLYMNEISIKELKEEIKPYLLDNSLLKNLTCELCKKTFEKSKNLRRHKKLHFEENKIYKCNHCEKVYNRSDHLKRHLVVHSSDKKPYKCPFCIMRYGYQFHLKKHIEKNHNHNEKNNNFCSICNINFHKKSQFYKHNYLHTGEKTYNCYYPYCDKSYFNQGKLNLHIEKSHKNNILSISTKLKKERNEEEETNRNFIDNKLMIHKTFNNSIVYSENSTLCLDKNDLNKIISYTINENQISEYDLNNQKYLNSKNIKIVEKQLNKNNKLKDKKISNNLFIHSKEKKFYRCPIDDCLKTYTSTYNLKVHIKTYHYKIQQFKCDVCNQMFNHKCSLNNHVQKMNHIIKNSINENISNDIDNQIQYNFEESNKKNINSSFFEFKRGINEDSNFNYEFFENEEKSEYSAKNEESIILKNFYHDDEDREKIIFRINSNFLDS